MQLTDIMSDQTHLSWGWSSPTRVHPSTGSGELVTVPARQTQRAGRIAFSERHKRDFQERDLIPVYVLHNSDDKTLHWVTPPSSVRVPTKLKVSFEPLQPGAGRTSTYALVVFAIPNRSLARFLNSVSDFVTEHGRHDFDIRQLTGMLPDGASVVRDAVFRFKVQDDGSARRSRSPARGRSRSRSVSPPDIFGSLAGVGAGAGAGAGAGVSTRARVVSPGRGRLSSGTSAGAGVSLPEPAPASTRDSMADRRMDALLSRAREVRSEAARRAADTRMANARRGTQPAAPVGLSAAARAALQATSRARPAYVEEDFEVEEDLSPEEIEVLAARMDRIRSARGPAGMHRQPHVQQPPASTRTSASWTTPAGTGTTFAPLEESARQRRAEAAGRAAETRRRNAAARAAQSGAASPPTGPQFVDLSSLLRSLPSASRR